MELLATRGCPQAEIAVAAGISEPTLRRAFREQLATAWAHRRVDEINRWFELSEQGDLAATIFLLGAGFAARGAR